MTDDVERYLIWSNEHQAWWGVGGRGYISRSDMAGRYTRDKALDICAKAVPGTAHRMKMLPELPVREIDLQHLFERFRGTYPGHNPESWP